jgi:hypothetical protein
MRSLMFTGVGVEVQCRGGLRLSLTWRVYRQLFNVGASASCAWGEPGLM